MAEQAVGELNGVRVFLTPKGVRLNHKGKVNDPNFVRELLSTACKGLRRIVRRHLRSVGQVNLASWRKR